MSRNIVSISKSSYWQKCPQKDEGTEKRNYKLHHLSSFLYKQKAKTAPVRNKTARPGAATSSWPPPAYPPRRKSTPYHCWSKTWSQPSGCSATDPTETKAVSPRSTPSPALSVSTPAPAAATGWAAAAGREDFCSPYAAFIRLEAEGNWGSSWRNY